MQTLKMQFYKLNQIYSFGARIVKIKIKITFVCSACDSI